MSSVLANLWRLFFRLHNVSMCMEVRGELFSQMHTLQTVFVAHLYTNVVSKGNA